MPPAEMGWMVAGAGARSREKRVEERCGMD